MENKWGTGMLAVMFLLSELLTAFTFCPLLTNLFCLEVVRLQLDRFQVSSLNTEFANYLHWQYKLDKLV